MPPTLPPVSLAATGHRPNKLGLWNCLGWRPRAVQFLRDFAFQQLNAVHQQHNLREVISGMAVGWDTAIALAALRLEIPLIAAIPFPNQPLKWPPANVEEWAWIKSQATEVITIADSYSLAAMQARNEYMVNRADIMLALWNGTPGGTANCLRYARRKDKPIIDCHLAWIEAQSCL